MTRQISENEGPAPVAVDETDFDGVFGVDQRRPGKCEHHGDFVDVHFSGARGPAAGWVGCPKCREQRDLERQRQQEAQKRYQDLYRRSQIPYRFQGLTFDDYEPANDKAARHLEKIRQYALDVAKGENEGQSLIMFGNVGTGKTHLACAALDYVMTQGCKPARYYSFSDLVREVKRTFNSNEPATEEDVYQRFLVPALVVVDEIGVQNFTEFEQSVAYEAINARYVEGKPTMLATNLPIKDLPHCLGDRAVDRLREGGGRALDFDWKSHRGGGQ